MHESFLNDNLELETIPKSAGVFVWDSVVSFRGYVVFQLNITFSK